MAAAISDQEMAPLLKRITGYGWIEQGGFLVLFSMMIAMRFGY